MGKIDYEKIIAEKEAEIRALKKERRFGNKPVITDDSTVGDRVRYFRMERGLSLVQLSDKAGFGGRNGNLSEMETGNRRISFRKVLALAKALQVRVEDLDPFTMKEIERVNELYTQKATPPASNESHTKYY